MISIKTIQRAFKSLTIKILKISLFLNAICVVRAFIIILNYTITKLNYILMWPRGREKNVICVTNILTILINWLGISWEFIIGTITNANFVRNPSTMKSDWGVTKLICMDFFNQPKILSMKSRTRKNSRPQIT